MRVPSSPWQTVPLLFLDPADSDFCAFLQEAHTLVERNPALLAAIEADLDRHSLAKKALRVADAQWWAARGRRPPLEGLAPSGEPSTPLRLDVGRPRTAAYVVYLFLVGRGYFGGFKTREATTLMRESVTLRVFLANQDHPVFRSGLDHEDQSTCFVGLEVAKIVTAAHRTSVESFLARIGDPDGAPFAMMLREARYGGGAPEDRLLRRIAAFRVGLDAAA